MPLSKTPRTTASRYPNQRLYYNQELVYSILDASLFCTVSYVQNGEPFALPTAFVRVGDKIYIHGSVGSHMIREIEKGLPVCITVFIADALVVAKSAFHHSINYRSVVLFSKAFPIRDDEKKYEVLKMFTEKIVPDSWDYLRPLTRKEMDKTTVLGFDVIEASAKMREGMPIDDKEDESLPIWSGLIPMAITKSKPIADESSKLFPLPNHLK